MPMAANHRRKRLNGVTIASCSSWDQYKHKKKKLESPQNELNRKSHISLEWDGNKRKVIAKREQIGLRQKDLREFGAPFHQRDHSVLADVLPIPQEIFNMENLSEVLSYQVWRTHLSENERKYLTQFLPRGWDAEQVVQALLAGDNFHFGNPCLKWGALLCSGQLHPDFVIHQEQCMKADKKAYYLEIQNYHNDMIEFLQKLKETWESSKDLDTGVFHKIWRSRRDVDEQISLHANGSSFPDLEENAVATSESCSLVGEDKACSSENQNSSVTKGSELQRRSHEKVLTRDKNRKPLIGLDDARSRRGEKLQKRNIHHIDGVKYMSYLKISKKQHELVKNMKQSGKSIQSKSLNRVLGNVDKLQVQPYEDFVKEEQNKLQDHWLKLAKQDVPAAYEYWRQRQFQRREIAKYLEQDLENRLESLVEDDNNLNAETVLQYQNDQGEERLESEEGDEEGPSQEIVLQDQDDYGVKEHDPYVKDEDKLNDETVSDDQSDKELTEHDSSVQEEEKASHDTVLLKVGERKQDCYVEDNKYANSGSPQFQSPHRDSNSGSPQFQSPRNVSSLDANDDVNPTDMDSEDNNVVSKSKSADVSPNASDYSSNVDAADASVSSGVPISDGRDVWPAVSMPHTFYDSSMNQEYGSNGQLSLPNPIDERQRPFIDLESDVHEEDDRKNMLHRQSDAGGFNSYPNQDRSGLLQSMFKGQDLLSYNCGQKLMGLDFQAPQSMVVEDGHFTGHLQSQLNSLSLKQGQKRHGEHFTQPPISEDIYREGAAFSVTRQGHEEAANLQNWPVNPVMSAQLQSHLNNDALLTQNWYSGEQQVRGGWNSTDSMSVSSQGISHNTDQSLFSVLSQYNQLRLSNQSNPVGPSEQFTLPIRNYEMASSVASRISTSLPQGALPLDYLNGRDTSSLMPAPDDMGWMGLPQNQGLHDSVGKPYLRSWNQ